MMLRSCANCKWMQGFLSTVLAVINVAGYISRSEADWGCFRVEFQHLIGYSGSLTELLEHKVTVLNIC